MSPADDYTQDQPGFKTIPLSPWDKANFETLKEALEAGDLCLLSAKRKSDGADVALVCVMGHKDGMFYPVPIAVMVEGNPFDLYDDPTQE